MTRALTSRGIAIRGGTAAALVLGGVLAAPPAAHAASTIEIDTVPGNAVAGQAIEAIATVEIEEEEEVPATVSITLFNDGDCGTPVPNATGTSEIEADGVFEYAYSVTTNQAGTYSWQATLTRNGATDISTGCTQPVVIAKATPGVATTPTNASVGEAIRNTATLSGRVSPRSTPTPVSITFRVFGPGNGDCSGTPLATTTRPVRTNENTYVSDDLRVDAAGTYRWTVAYSGDANNAAIVVGCSVGASTVTAEVVPDERPGRAAQQPPQTPTCAGLPATILGDGKGNRIRGTNGNDVIVGGAGADTIDGRGGRDLICGGSGPDRLTGGGGADELRGGGGKDRLTGGRGSDRLVGGGGTDRGAGGPGSDSVRSVERQRN